LADAVHDFAQEAPDQHQRDELREEDHVRGIAPAAVGGKGAIRSQEQRNGCPGRRT
jgi:hypothetical protein